MAWIKRSDALVIVQRRFPQYGIDEKALENWTRSGGECPPTKQGPRLGYDEVAFAAWLDRLAPSLVTLNRDDYNLCLNFAIEAYYGDITHADFNRAKQRDVGEFLTNQIQGKLGEIALRKMLLPMGIEIELDFKASGGIPSQDVTRISTRKGIWNNPAAKVSIKCTKFKNVLLAVSANEAILPDRKSDAYVLSNVGLFPDHLLRFSKAGLEGVRDDVRRLIAEFRDVPARVSGWVPHEFLTSMPLLSGDEIKKKFDIQMASPNYVLRTGDLQTDWPPFIKRLTGT